MAERSVGTTTRAYTLRLTGATPEDHTWRDYLWKTHEAVNAGARAFGEWLLTMRGGLSHELAEEALQGKPPSEEEQRHRRVVLALSWLSVESPACAIAPHLIVATGKEGRDERARQVLVALREVLAGRGLPSAEIDTWVRDCEAALSAEIREDAVWVNRSRAFDKITGEASRSIARADCRELLWYLFTDSYLALPREKVQQGRAQRTQADHSAEESEEDRAEAGRSAVVRSGQGAGHRTRHLFSHVFGTKGDSAGFGKPPRKLALREHWWNHLKPMVEGTGIPMRDPNQRRHRGDSAAPTELHREMLSKAASRLAQIHTKQKQQEVERAQRERADEALCALERDAAHAEPLSLLQTYCEERRGELGEYTLRPAAVTGWDRVVAAWAQIQSDTDDSEIVRIDAVKRLQDTDRERKFGDANLFARLAADEYVPVWWHNGREDPSILMAFVKGIKARADSTRLKVAAYRHPDPYLNPVFCQFGKDRPRIKFGRLGQLKRSKESGSDKSSAVSLLLWDGKQAREIILQALGERLDAEIGCLEEQRPPEHGPALVTRRTRQGFAATAQESAPCSGSRVIGVFDRKEVKPRNSGDGDVEVEGGPKRRGPEWNGTLQADRRTLAAIATVPSLDTAAERRERLHWWLAVSLELQPQGPWPTYAKQNCIKLDGRGNEIVTRPRRQSDEWRGLTYPFWHPDDNTGRVGDAKLLLSRLPGLRILSVDLGHRAAAACAVWETLSSQQIADDCRTANEAPPAGDALYLHLQTQGENGKPRTTIYRRIGADALPDGTTHPAPWARLERQFTVKLQGEDSEARRATPEELGAVEGFDSWLGRQEPGRRSWRVDELMSETVRVARLGLLRHGDRARIAWGLTATRKQLPGGREAEQAMTPDELTSHLQEVLLRWHDLAFSARWNDPEARSLWQQHIESLSQYTELQAMDEELSRPEQRKRRDANREALRGVAGALARTGRTQLHRLWATRWCRDDAEWCRRLRWLRDWIAPRGKRGRHDKEIRRVGGLSLTRLTAFKSLYQVQKAFFTRLTPAGRQMKKDEQGQPTEVPLTAGEEFGQGLLDDLEAMRENRVKQLASRIAEAALGIGSENRAHWERGTRRPREHIFAPCHAVVIESLTHYRPDELRTRRENRQLMDWSSSKVKKHLAEACELNGLHLREVSPGYTSRQDSRTGAPGVRCQNVTVRDFKQSPYWQREVARAKRNCTGKSGTARERLLCAAEQKLTQLKEGGVKLLCLPRDGGELFVSADPHSPAAHGLNADLNAAANIGLRALLDPDWEGRWWYVPCDSKEFKPVEKSVKGAAAICLDCALKTTDSALEVKNSDAAPSKRARTGSRARDKEVVNLWRDPCTRPITESAGPWKTHSEYWNSVQARVAELLHSRLSFLDKE